MRVDIRPAKWEFWSPTLDQWVTSLGFDPELAYAYIQISVEVGEISVAHFDLQVNIRTDEGYEGEVSDIPQEVINAVFREGKILA